MKLTTTKSFSTRYTKVNLIEIVDWNSILLLNNFKRHHIFWVLDMVLEKLANKRGEMRQDDWNRRRLFVKKTCLELQIKMLDYQIEQHKQNETK